MTIRFYTSVYTQGNKILYRGYNNGKRVQNKIEYQPSLYTKSTKKQDSEFKGLFGENLEQHTFDSIAEAKRFIKDYEDVSNYKIYGNNRWEYQFIAANFPEDSTYDFDRINIQSIDIETTTENSFPDPKECLEKITLVTFQNIHTKEIVTFSCLENVDPSKNRNVRQYKSEIDMLNDIVVYFQQSDIDILTGWNIEGFDIPYLVGRMNMLLGEDRTSRISPWNIVNKREFTSKFGDELTYEIKGISCIDYLQLYKKFTYVTRENYTLGHIAECELGYTKVENPYDTFKDFYQTDPNLFTEYNQKDVTLITDLEDKLGLLKLVVSMATTMKVNFNDVFSPVRSWEAYINATLAWENTFAPLKKVSKSEDSIEGGYVKEPIPGLYNWVCSFDLNSLYPHIIMACNMSPETITGMVPVTVKELLEHGTTGILAEMVNENGLAVAANGSCYEKTKVGILPRLMRKLYDGRKTEKKKMLQYKNEKQQFSSDSTEYKELDKKIALAHTMQLNLKIMLNSAYGAVANNYFQFFDNRIAEGITKSGQLIIQRAGNDLNNYLNKLLKTVNKDYIVASDTDSLYTNLNDLCDTFGNKNNIEFLSKAADQMISKKLNEYCNNLSTTMGWNQNLIEFKLENIADVAFWTGKKRYAMNVLESEGVRYKEPEIKITGLEIVRSSTPAVVRDMLRNTVSLILRESEESVQQYYTEIVDKFNSYSVEDISFPRSTNNLSQYSDPDSIYKKGTPIAVRGALLYNHYLKKNKLDKKYQLIREGDKVKFVYLKVPNTIREDVIAYIGKLPTELKLHSYVDYDRMFEKTYLDPLKHIMQAIGWEYETKQTLEDFFG